MLHSPVRFIVLTGLLWGGWLLLSGIYIPRLIVTGLVASAFISWVMGRIGLLDEETLPVSLLPRALAYWLWLGWEIVKAALNVTRLVLHPALPISPTLITFTPNQKTDVGRVVHANSITLTPGTITTGISVSGNMMQVHGIERKGSLGCVDSEMDSRVCWFEKALIKRAEREV